MSGAASRILDELVGRFPVLADQRKNIASVYEIFKTCYESGGKLLIGGNGGSSADSAHIVGELMKSFVRKRPVPEDFSLALKELDPENADMLSGALQGALPAIDITGHTALNTAFANDVENGGILSMAQQVYGYGTKGDVFWGITTSGNARNVLLAASVARAKGLYVAGLTGRDGGRLKHQADACVIVPENETFKIQELHLPVYHALCLMLEETFFPE